MAQVIDPNELMFTAFQPKTSNRFVLYVDGIPSFICKKVNRPVIANNEVILKHMNVERYVKGRSAWEAMSGIELYDPVVPSAAQMIMEWVRLHHESVTGRDGFADFYKKDITINVMDPVGAKVEEWKLKGAWIQEANFGEMDFASSDPVDITLSLRYDYAILQF